MPVQLLRHPLLARQGQKLAGPVASSPPAEELPAVDWQLHLPRSQLAEPFKQAHRISAGNCDTESPSNVPHDFPKLAWPGFPSLAFCHFDNFDNFQQCTQFLAIQTPLLICCGLFLIEISINTLNSVAFLQTLKC